ncbi:MAG: UDP-3-O-(3-hydroxymyristoyl)glucosamine N-acyltransferase [Acidobacteriota bacterium]|jgi:UDP-3-O-[3-hydroxymyristoyl] glucosamine N-acyltransferase|nr:UDP-3-O-(3-hydroxymyristoyl)glucosamine N-acyltransferase [Acidobacteriota bacterium]
MKLSEVAKKLGCRMVGRDVDVVRVAGIDQAGDGDLTFVSNRKYVSRIKTTRASAIILGEDIPDVETPSLRTDDPYFAFARALELFSPRPRPEPGVHPTAVVGAGAVLGEGVHVGAYAVIGENCRVGAGTILHPHVVLYPDVVVGAGCELHALASVREGCRLGDRVVLQNGVVVGGDGFGFAPLKDGTFYKIRQTGAVVIEDDVEIGAGTTIDRAAVGDTVIRKGAKLDNLVQVGHGAEVGAHSVLAAQSGLAGSTRLGRNVWVGGQVGFAGHIEVGDGAVITAQSGTSHDVPAGAVVSGSPAFKNSEWLRSTVAFAKLPELGRRVRELEKALARLTAGGGEKKTGDSR